MLMFIRSILFYILLAFWTIFLGLICIPFLFFSSIYLYKPARLWIRGIFFFLKYVAKITHEIQGYENVPKEPVLIISKHQSAFETLALFFYLKNTIFIHKKQLYLIPIFGLYLKKINMISIDRKSGAAAMRQMLKETHKRKLDGYSIIIFPEGTRKVPNAIPDYKSGFIGIYKEMNTKILPVALNSGLCWPKNKLAMKRGNIIIKILPTIKSGMDKKDVFPMVESVIEKATNKIT